MIRIIVVLLFVVIISIYGITMDFIKKNWAILIAMFAGAMMVRHARRAGVIETNVKHQETTIRQLNKGTVVDIAEAAALQVVIAENKKHARDVRKKAEANLNRIGQDETMADIAERFNNKRVRSRADSAT